MDTGSMLTVLQILSYAKTAILIALAVVSVIIFYRLKRYVKEYQRMKDFSYFNEEWDEEIVGDLTELKSNIFSYTVVGVLTLFPLLYKIIDKLIEIF